MATTTSTSPLPPPKSNFVFINDSNPQDAKSKAKRKLVRAQAARGPHSTASGPNGCADNTKNASSMNKHQSLKRKKDRANTTTFQLNIAGLGDNGPQSKKPIVQDTSETDGVTVKVIGKGSQPESLQRKTGASPSTHSATPQKPTAILEEDDVPSSNSSANLVPRMPGTGWVAPFISHPDPGRPYIPMLIDHCE